MYEFDWSSIPGALPFLWEGMKVSLEITLTRGLRHRVGHGAGDDALSSVKPLAGLPRLREPVPGDSAGDGAAVVLPDRAAVLRGASTSTRTPTCASPRR
jgi:hypothetical protein